jgi:hypothetical protein
MLSFREFFFAEHVLSIGMNPEHEKFREKHRQEIHDIIHNSYKKVDGGYGGLGSGSKAESDAIHHDISHSMIKATKRAGKITSVNMYKDKFGRKSIAAGTDGTDVGKADYMKTKKEDHHQKRAWGEVSGASEHIGKKIGNPVIPNSRAKELTGKDVERHADGEHYTRMIGGHPHVKTIIGHPKVDK